MKTRKSPSNFIDLTGKTFGKLSVVCRAGNTPKGKPLWECICLCGRLRLVEGQKLRTGHTKSCGCSRVGNATHGKSGTRTHNSWMAMKQRCYYRGNSQYHRYGERGISVCERWLNSFENFLADMGERPLGKTLDRINGDQGYSKENCRWATPTEQARNTARNILIERNGETKCVLEWCQILGLNHDQVYGRIRWGMSPQEALK